MKLNSDRDLHILVLKKLKRFIHDGSFASGEARYIYKWDNTQETTVNLANATRESVVLRYYINSGLIVGEQTPNEYRQQQLAAPDGMWSDWLETDGARREFYYEVFMYRIDIDKFEKEIAKFQLTDTGVELTEQVVDQSITPLSEPILVMKGGAFKLHDSYRISYNDQEIIMQTQIRKVAALIMKNSNVGTCTTADNITDAYDIANVVDVVSRARAAFKNATKQNKNLFPNKREIGYSFIG